MFFTKRYVCISKSCELMISYKHFAITIDVKYIIVILGYFIKYKDIVHMEIVYVI